LKTEPMLFVADVQKSSKWYQDLLGAKSGHGGPEYEMILDEEGELLFQLHKLDGDEHGMNLSDTSIPRGMGVLIYVHVPDVQVIFEQAKDMKAVIESEPTFIELARHTECIVKDPDGYSLALYSR
jgi:catechol 2,3-dioxygenase-like lactoylglutathione lyase family enzyme